MFIRKKPLQVAVCKFWPLRLRIRNMFIEKLHTQIKLSNETFVEDTQSLNFMINELKSQEEQHAGSIFGNFSQSKIRPEQRNLLFLISK